MSTAIVSVLMRLDIFLIGALTNQAQVGLFDTANSMAQGVPLLTASLSTVLLPRLAATRSRDEMLRIVGQFLRASPIVLGGIALAGVAAHLLIPLLRHGRYNGSAAIFDVLVCAYVLTIFGSPISFFCLAFERASWLTWMNLAQLVLNVFLSLLFIPRLGGMGGALAILGVRLFAMAYLLVAFRRLLAMAQPGAARNTQ
jgi:O-antigen/teichoic acid export membrane protein